MTCLLMLLFVLFNRLFRKEYIRNLLRAKKLNSNPISYLALILYLMIILLKQLQIMTYKLQTSVLFRLKKKLN